MMLLRFLAPLLLLLPAPLLGQTVTIRSGWQETFTRLVFSIEAGTEWQLARDGEGYVLVLDGEDIDFDTSTVFDRIPGTRLAAVAETEGSLHLDLACECHATGFLWRPDRLVVDILDGPADPQSPFERNDTVSLAAERLDEIDPLEEGTGPAQSTRIQAAVSLPVIFQSQPADISALIPDPFAVREEQQERLIEAERALIESIARASTQGLLEPVTSLDLQEPDEPAEEPAEQVAESETPPMPEHAATSPGIIAHTSIDRDLGASEPFISVSGSSQSTCLPDEHFAIGDWGDDRPFGDQIGEARRTLLEEFDRASDGSALRLARNYLYFGFGAEALQALAFTQDTSLETRILFELAIQIDGLPGGGQILDNQLGCDGSSALWSLLGRTAIPARPELNRNSILRYYQTLPRPVQAQIAGRLAPMFIEANDEDAAAILLSNIHLSPGGDGEDIRLAEAELAMHYGDAERSFSEMVEAVRVDGRAGPETFLRIYELAETTGTAMPDDLMDLSAVLRFEFRGQPIVEDLATAEMRAFLAREEFDRALETVEDERTRLSPDGLQLLLSELVIAMTFGLEDVAFLEQMLGHIPRPISAVAENAVARRLLDLGLGSAALDVLQTTPVREAARERRYLRAEIALQLGDHRRVADLLTAMTDPRADALRAAALVETGDFAEAFAVELNGVEDVDAGAAWRAGAWSRLAATDDPDLRAVSRLVLGEPPETRPDPLSDVISSEASAPADLLDSEDPQPLAEGRALLRESEATRNILDSVLARFDVEDEGATR